MNAAAQKPEKRSVGMAIAWRLLLLGALAGGFFGAWSLRAPTVAKPLPVDGERHHVELRGDEPQLGRDDALITIVEFGDYGCEHCSTAAGALKQVLAESEDVRLVFKHYSLASSDAARAAAAAQRHGRFWEMHDWLLAHRGAAAAAADYANELGIDPAAFARSAASEQAEGTIRKDRQAADTIGLAGLPSFFVNGRPYVGALGIEQWREIVADEREFARGILERGVPADGVYAYIMSGLGDARTPP